MTISEAISRTDDVKPNAYSEARKIMWLSELDGMIKTEIIDTHQGGDSVSFNGYDIETDVLTTELIVPAPYDVLYLRYLEMKIDFSNGEYSKYNNSMMMYNAAYSAFENYYNREHMPISRGRRFVF